MHPQVCFILLQDPGPLPDPVSQAATDSSMGSPSKPPTPQSTSNQQAMTTKRERELLKFIKAELANLGLNVFMVSCRRPSTWVKMGDPHGTTVALALPTQPVRVLVSEFPKSFDVAEFNQWHFLEVWTMAWNFWLNPSRTGGTDYKH